ncbi:MAG: stage III sporulation protein AC [Eubacterium sp.]|jgi:stage III sporulation protein AC
MLRGRNTVEITIIFKIALVGILVTILNQILKQSGRDEQAFIVSLAGLLLVLFWIIPYISQLFETIQDMFVL